MQNIISYDPRTDNSYDELFRERWPRLLGQDFRFLK